MDEIGTFLEKEIDTQLEVAGSTPALSIFLGSLKTRIEEEDLAGQLEKEIEILLSERQGEGVATYMFARALMQSRFFTTLERLVRNETRGTEDRIKQSLRLSFPSLREPLEIETYLRKAEQIYSQSSDKTFDIRSIQTSEILKQAEGYDVLPVSFTVEASREQFLRFLSDLSSSLSLDRLQSGEGLSDPAIGIDQIAMLNVEGEMIEAELDISFLLHEVEEEDLSQKRAELSALKDQADLLRETKTLKEVVAADAANFELLIKTLEDIKEVNNRKEYKRLQDLIELYEGLLALYEE